jgi:hypothetical protein
MAKGSKVFRLYGGIILRDGGVAVSVVGDTRDAVCNGLRDLGVDEPHMSMIHKVTVSAGWDGEKVATPICARGRHGEEHENRETVEEVDDG